MSLLNVPFERDAPLEDSLQLAAEHGVELEDAGVAACRQYEQYKDTIMRYTGGKQGLADQRRRVNAALKMVHGRKLEGFETDAHYQLFVLTHGVLLRKDGAPQKKLSDGAVRECGQFGI